MSPWRSLKLPLAMRFREPIFPTLPTPGPGCPWAFHAKAVRAMLQLISRAVSYQFESFSQEQSWNWNAFVKVCNVFWLFLAWVLLWDCPWALKHRKFVHFRDKNTKSCGFASAQTAGSWVENAESFSKPDEPRAMFTPGIWYLKQNLSQI